MAKNINHIQHIKSNVVVEGLPKLPDASVLVEGELAVNYAAGVETISLKNSSGDIVTFSSDNYYTEKKLGDMFSSSTVSDVLAENESAITAAITDLDERKLEASDLDSFFDEKLGSAFTGENSGVTVTEALENSELTTSAALNDLNTRKLDASAYTPTDLSNYYNKQEVDSMVSAISGDIGSTVISAVTELSGDVETVKEDVSGLTESIESLSGIIEDNELVIASALNDLNSRINEVSGAVAGDITDVINDVNELTGDVESLSGDVETLKEDAESLSGDVETLSGTVEELTETVENNELVTSAALNDLNSRINSVSGDVANMGSVTEDISELSGSVTSITDEFHAFSGEVEDNALVISSALNDLNSRIIELSGSTIDTIAGEIESLSATVVNNYYTSAQTDAAIESATSEFFDDVEYDSAEKKINFKHGNTVKKFIDATDFIKDGMVSSAYTSAVTESGETTNYLVIEFNTDAEKDVVKIDISEIFNPDVYYTKEEIDDSELVISSSLNDLNSRKLDASAYTPTDLSDYYTKEEVDASISGFVSANTFEEMLGSGFTGDNSGNTVTKVILDNELVVSAALNDLNTRVSEISGNAVSLDSTVTSGSTNGVTSQGIYNAIEASKMVLDNEFSYSASSSSTNAVEAQAIMSYLGEKELVIASSLNDLNARVNNVSGDVETLKNSQLTVDNVFDEEHSSGSSNPVAASALFGYVNEIDLGTSSALNDLNTRLLQIVSRLDAIDATLTSLDSRISALENA